MRLFLIIQLTTVLPIKLLNIITLVYVDVVLDKYIYKLQGSRLGDIRSNALYGDI